MTTLNNFTNFAIDNAQLDNTVGGRRRRRRMSNTTVTLSSPFSISVESSTNQVMFNPEEVTGNTYLNDMGDAMINTFEVTNENVII